MKKLTLPLMLALIVIALLSLTAITPGAPVSAQVRQTATPAPAGEATVTTPTSAIDTFFVACADAAIVNFSGNLVSGFSIYYQLFASDGSEVTTLRRAEAAAGDVGYSERVAYPAGTALSAGAALTMQVRVARTNNANTIDFEFTASDVQDGCANPQFELVSSTDTGISASTSDTTTGRVGFDRPIRAPGGFLNSNLQPETAVVIGARPSDRFRSDTPGLIFAECNRFPLAEPGIIYDTDRVVVYWSWFTRTRAQMDQHLANAQYSVRMNGATFNRVAVSTPEQRGGNFWVFYTADVGNLRPGHYEVEYRLTWAQKVFDGFEEFGPGSDNVQEAGNCNFNVLLNPNGLTIAHNLEFVPTDNPVHNITGE
jgi:hypothetical protein